MNKKITKEIGPKFQKIRKHMHITLNDVSEKVGITSTSTLSRWERGETGLSIEIFDKIISSMNISYNELIGEEVELKNLIKKVELLYQKNNVQELKKLSLLLLKKYHLENNKYLHSKLLIESAIANNFYLDLTGVDLTDNKYKNELSNQFNGVKYLFKKEIILFGDVQLLLDTDTIYKLSRSLVSKVYEKELISQTTSITILNAVFVLIKRKATDKARIILKTTSKLNFSQNDLLTKVRIRFMQALLTYIYTHKEYVISQFLDSLGDKDLKENCTFAFHQIKNIYGLGN